MQCAGCGVEVVGQSACPGCGTPVPDADQLANDGPALPSAPWTLTAPESYALRYGPAGGSTRVGAFKAALTELLARRALLLHGAFVRRRLMPGSSGVWLLSDGPRLASVTEPTLTPILDAYRNARRGRRRHAVTQTGEPVRGILITDLVRSAANRRGGLRRYARRDLADALKQRGLLDDDGKLTAEGKRADRELEAWIELAKGPFAHRAARDESWARAYLAGAGAAVLLVSDAYPQLARLGAAAAAGPTPDQTFAVVVGPQDGALDFTGLVDGGLSGLDDAFAVVDSSFAGFGGDAGGGDGGGG